MCTLRSILLCDYKMIPFSFLLDDEHFKSFQFGTVTNATAMNILSAYMSFDEHMCPFLLGIYLDKNCGMCMCSVLIVTANSVSSVVPINTPTDSV